ncbi:hypothetical protein J4G08_02790 [Candidatus Poribacteria bacterium]|nr:hypothetical protein [Candidatus Poribacteria bacterium]
MFEFHPSGLKRYQNIAGIAGGIGFVLGTVIPGVAILTHNWHCPFGDGMLQTTGFLAITGFSSAIVLGNLVAFLLVGIARYQHGSRKSSHRKGDSDGN